MKFVFVAAAVLVLAFSSACDSQALVYARTKFPSCEVHQIEDSGDSVRVSVQCPNEEPFEKTYREQ